MAEKICDYSTLSDSDSEIADLTVREVLANYSFPEHYLVSACHFIYDSRQPEFKVPCSDVQPPLTSLQNGRRCLTYFTRLNKLFKHHTINYHNLHYRHQQNLTRIATRFNSMKMTNTEQYTWYIHLELNMSAQPAYADVNPDNFTDTDPNVDELKYRLMDSDVLLALHTPNSVPSMLGADYMSIDIGAEYQIHYSKQITNLKPPPFQTKCREYSKKKKPRSSNECMSICQLQNYLDKECINPNVLITKDLLTLFDSHSPKINSSNIKFCFSDCSVLQYIEYVSRRKNCKKLCGRDCEEENYDLITESNSLPILAENWANASYVTIKPDRNFIQRIEHNSDMDFYQFIGNLGGILHLYLGLSAIQLYDVCYKLIGKVKTLWKMFVEW